MSVLSNQTRSAFKQMYEAINELKNIIENTDAADELDEDLDSLHESVMAFRGRVFNVGFNLDREKQNK